MKKLKKKIGFFRSFHFSSIEYFQVAEKLANTNCRLACILIDREIDQKFYSFNHLTSHH